MERNESDCSIEHLCMVRGGGGGGGEGVRGEGGGKCRECELRRGEVYGVRGEGGGREQV